MVGDFRAPDLHYTGWLEHVSENQALQITNPVEGTVFFTDLGANKKEITVIGTLPKQTVGKILVIVRSDRDYPQALGKPRADGTWIFSGIDLGGVDLQLYAVLVADNDIPLYRSPVITIRLERRFSEKGQ